ncbi:MAG TPA: hypothetical protein VF085_02800 [Solirubrobacterales bacterium]
MIRKFKTLGIALFATLGMSSVTASAASANPFFHSEFAGIFLTGGQTGVVANTFTTDLGEMKCKVVNFSGSQGAMTTTTMTLKPKYQECKMAGENATVTLNGCAYTFHLEEQAEPIEARMGIECPFAGGKIEIDVGECTITVPAQEPRKTVTFTNEGEGTTRSVIADLNVSGIEYVEHGATCASQKQTTENGTYTGVITVKGEDSEENHVGIWVK